MLQAVVLEGRAVLLESLEVLHLVAEVVAEPLVHQADPEDHVGYLAGCLRDQNQTSQIHHLDQEARQQQP